MPTIMPHSELVRRAVEYIALEAKAARQKGCALSPEEMYKLVETASLRFDLSPIETRLLNSLLSDAQFQMECGLGEESV